MFGYKPGVHFDALESEEGYSPLLRSLALGTVGAAMYFAHTSQLRSSPAYAVGLYKWAKKFEDISPSHIGSTLGLSERASSYIVNEINFAREQIVSNGELTETGQHFQKLVGDSIDIKSLSSKGLKFKRTLKGSPFLELEGMPTVKVRFAPAGFRMAGSSYRYNKPLSEIPVNWAKEGSVSSRLWENFHKLRHSQDPFRLNPIKGTMAKDTAISDLRMKFAPWYAKVESIPGDSGIEELAAAAKNFKRSVGPQIFELFERPQRILADIGLGLKQGTYNKAFHIPFVQEGGLLNNLLLKRVLPIAIGLTAAGWLDYKTGHKVSNGIINLPLKANVLRAELTDRIPGARKLTDWYSKEEGVLPQYAPIALPMGGMFIGGMLHMAKVVMGKYNKVEGGVRAAKIARDAAGAVLPNMKVLRATTKEASIGKAIAKAWSGFGLPGKGAVVGLALMLPFLPGMIGSRKSASELRRIYSGEEEVPIRQGRWWEVGCQIASNQQLTSIGIKTVEEIYDNRLTITNGKGEFELPSNWFKYNYKGYVCKLKVVGIPIVQGFTPNHKLPIYKNGAIIEERIDELSVGDLVLSTRMKTNESLKFLECQSILQDGSIDNDRIYSSQVNCRHKDLQKSGSTWVPEKLVLDHELGWLFGHFLSEGNLNSSSVRLQGIEHVCAYDEYNELALIKETYEKKFGCQAVFYTAKEKAYRLRVSSSILAKLFSGLFYQQGKKIFNLYSFENAPREFFKGVIEGWFYGDGGFHEYGASIRTRDLDNVIVIQKILSMFGASSITRKIVESFPDDYQLDSLAGKSYEGYRLYINKESLIRLSEESVHLRKGTGVGIEGIIKPTAKKSLILKDYIAYEILSIDIEFYDGPVFDCSISSDSHYEVLGYITHNSTPFVGTRISGWRPHESLILKSHAHAKSLYGSEEEYWAHNILLHPIKHFKDPYYLEKLHYKDRPYSITSPAFSNVPLIGPLLAATIGKVMKPTIRMHEDEWREGQDYTLYSSRLEPRGPGALAPELPKEEFSLWHAFKREAVTMAEFIGLPGFIMKSAFNAAYPRQSKEDVYLQGSRQMDSTSRSYYEKNLGAGMFVSPELDHGFMGYTEPLRRFIQHEGFSPQVNELTNTMPSWMPGEEYLINFHKGDPYVKVDEGFARLPGKGYEALHPELEGVNPEDYPDIYKMKILADIAPYSREYQKFSSLVQKASYNNPDLKVEYERVAEQVRKVKESTLQVSKRHFNAPVDNIEGTVDKASIYGVELKEYPGRVFKFSAVGSSISDVTAEVLGRHNNYTKSQAVQEADSLAKERAEYISSVMAQGTHIKAVVPKGAADLSTDIRAVFSVDGENINRELIHRGYGKFREELGGAEEQALHGRVGKLFGKYTEELFFEGDQSSGNPLRYLPTPFHTKFAQERTAYSQYVQQESVGTRMRRWNRPIHDFIAPYLRGAIARITGNDMIPDEIKHRRDLDTMTDMLSYIRSLNEAANDQEHSGRYTSQSKRTNIGADLYGSPGYVASTLPTREARYFKKFLEETDPDVREKILNIVPDETKAALQAQWIKQQQAIQKAKGEKTGPNKEEGRPYYQEDVDDYNKAKTKLQLGDYLRSRQIARFFFTRKLHLPDKNDEALLNPDLDYQDVKLKIVNQEGYDAHDFNIYDDRSQLLWRKPYVDGAVRELTSGDSRSQEQIRQAVEQMMIAAGNNNPDVRYTTKPADRSRGNITITADQDDKKELLTDIRRNKEDYKN